jgi:FOG: HEAT repeat
VKTRRKSVWIFLSCAIAAVLLFLLLHEPQPRYAGDTLGEWVYQLGATRPNPIAFTLAANPANPQGRTLLALGLMLDKRTSHAEADAETAIERIGPAAVPFLIKWTNYHERPWRQRLAVLCYKLPPKFRIPASRFVIGRGYEMREGAYSALAILGPQAKAAIPALSRQVETATQIGAADYPLMILGRMGEDGLPTILQVLRNPANPNRPAAILALSHMDPGLIFNENITATLITCLDDTNRTVALTAGGILCSHKFDQEVVMRIFTAALQANDRHIRQEAATPIRVCLMQGFSVPTLLDLLRDTNSPYSSDAALVLQSMILSDIKMPDTVLPGLLGSLSDSRAKVRRHSATAIGNLREAAEPAVSSLLDLWNDPDVAVRWDATNALYQIPAYAVLKDVALLDNITTEPARTKWIQRWMTDTPAPELTQLFQHPDPRIRQMATNAVQKLRQNSSENQRAASANH